MSALQTNGIRVDPLSRTRFFEDQMKALEQRIGYRFKDPTLLVQALTYRSFAALCPAGRTCVSNSALEVEGDKILAVEVERLLRTNRMKGAHKRRKTAAWFFRTNLHLSVVGMHLQLNECVRLVYPGSDWNSAEQQIRFTANALEALIGALFQDGGEAASRAFVSAFITNPSSGHYQEHIMRIAVGSIERAVDACGVLARGRGTVELTMQPARPVRVCITHGTEKFVREHGRSHHALLHATYAFFSTHPWILWGYDQQKPVPLPCATLSWYPPDGVPHKEASGVDEAQRHSTGALFNAHAP